MHQAQELCCNQPQCQGIFNVYGSTVPPTGVKWEGILVLWAIRRAQTGADNGRHERGGSQSPEQRIFLAVVFRHGSDVKSGIGWVFEETCTAQVFSSICRIQAASLDHLYVQIIYWSFGTVQQGVGNMTKLAIRNDWLMFWFIFTFATPKAQASCSVWFYTSHWLFICRDHFQVILMYKYN